MKRTCPRCKGVGSIVIKPPGRKRLLDYAQARRMKQAGKTAREIAEHFGVSEIAVWKALAKQKR